MALALLSIGILLLVAGVRGTQQDLFAELQKDFTGANNFFEWLVAFVLIGAIGFIPRMKPISTGLLALVILAIFLKRGTGFFDQFTSAVQGTQK
jgi:hypothetical protein